MTTRMNLLAFGILSLSLACSGNTKFSRSPDMGTAAKAADAVPASTLDVTVPVHEIRSGKKILKATATVNYAEDTRVSWTLEGPSGVDLGAIDSKGVYTSPASVDGDLEVVIRGSLTSDKSVTDSETIKVIPAEQIFVGCNAGSEVFPIKAEVYSVPRDSSQLPDFSTLSGSQLSTVCMDQYNVPERSFNEGFPGVEGLNEWFALHTSGKLVIKTAGVYNFRLNSDDGSMLYIDGSTVVDNNGLHSARSAEGSIILTAGVHDLVLDYYQGPADRIALELFWQVPGDNGFVVVPSEAFQK